MSQTDWAQKEKTHKFKSHSVTFHVYQMEQTQAQKAHTDEAASVHRQSQSWCWTVDMDSGIRMISYDNIHAHTRTQHNRQFTVQGVRMW